MQYVHFPTSCNPLTADRTCNTVLLTLRAIHTVRYPIRFPQPRALSRR